MKAPWLERWVKRREEVADGDIAQPLDSIRGLKIGEIVLYALTPEDIEEVCQRRYRGPLFGGGVPHYWHTVPAIVVWVHDDGGKTFNGQAFLDGNDTLWVRDVLYDAAGKPGTWRWNRTAGEEYAARAVASLRVRNEHDGRVW